MRKSVKFLLLDFYFICDTMEVKLVFKTYLFLFNLLYFLLGYVLRLLKNLRRGGFK